MLAVNVNVVAQEWREDGSDDVWHGKVVASVDFTIVEFYLKHRGGNHDGVDDGDVGTHA